MSHDKKALKACVIGYPIKHSLSPIIHGHWLAEHDIGGTYIAREIHPDNLKGDIQALIDEGFDGFNITLPHKQAIIRLCDQVDPAARAIGAVNTVKINDDGTLSGFNTDAPGFWGSIKETLPDFDGAGKAALVLGAGGASRAVIYALKQAGFNRIIVSNRTHEKAQALAGDFGAETIAWDDRINLNSAIDFVVNTTALGMTGQRALDFDLAGLSKDTVVTDIVYNPRRTDLLIRADASGHPVVEGLGMLLHQAVPAFEKWTGVAPKVTPVLYDKLYEALS